MQDSQWSVPTLGARHKRPLQNFTSLNSSQVSLPIKLTWARTQESCPSLAHINATLSFLSCMFAILQDVRRNKQGERKTSDALTHPNKSLLSYA